MINRSFLLVGLLLVLGMTGCDQELLGRIDKLEAQAARQLAEGDAFLSRNREQSGVIELPSGLQYRVLREGQGRQPSLTDRVSAHYRGRLINGTEFDSSYSRGKPAEFPVNRLIPGWTEALQLMAEGSHWQLFIPAKLAYGQRSPSTKIPSNSVLIFELELLDVLDD